MTMSQCLQELGARPELLSDRQRGELHNKGYTLLRGSDRSALAGRAARALRGVDGPRKGTRPAWRYTRNRGRAGWPTWVNKGSVFDRVWSHPLLLAAVHCVIDAPFHFGSLNARDALPGEGLQALHQDAHADPPPYGCNSVWMLDDFGPENGCTRLVPGSFRRPHPREVLDDPKAPCPEEELMVAPAGSVAVFNAYTWHGGTLNRTRDAHRRALHCFFNPRGEEQQTDQRAYLRPETEGAAVVGATFSSWTWIRSTADERFGARASGTVGRPAGRGLSLRHRPAGVRRSRGRARVAAPGGGEAGHRAPHYHRRRLTEIYYVLSGSGQIEYGRRVASADGRRRGVDSQRGGAPGGPRQRADDPAQLRHAGVRPGRRVGGGLTRRVSR